MLSITICEAWACNNIHVHDDFVSFLEHVNRWFHCKIELLYSVQADSGSGAAWLKVAW